MITPVDLAPLKRILNPEAKIALLSHYNPDGDAVGSCLGLYHVLKNAGFHQVKIIVPNDFPKFLKWLAGAKNILIGEYQSDFCQRYIEQAEVIFCLDFNDHSRAGILQDWINHSRATKVLIDHHQQPSHYQVVFSDTQAPATSQIVYEIIEGMGWLAHLDLNAAEAIYTGILTDTGGFKTNNTQAKTHHIVAQLLEKGIEVGKITSKIWETYSWDRMQLLTLLLKNMELVEEGKIAISTLSREQMLAHRFQKGDTDAFVNQGLKVESTVASVLFTEDLHKDMIKISFRSKGQVDMNQFARKYFEGGGHINASGGRSFLSLAESVERFKALAKELLLD